MSRAGKCKDTGSACVTARGIRKRILEHTVDKDVAVCQWEHFRLTEWQWPQSPENTQKSIEVLTLKW